MRDGEDIAFAPDELEPREDGLDVSGAKAVGERLRVDVIA